MLTQIHPRGNSTDFRGSKFKSMSIFNYKQSFYGIRNDLFN